MSKIPTLKQTIQTVKKLGLAKRRKAPQGRKPKYSDSYIIALAVYQKLARFKYAQQMLEVLASLGQEAPSPATFSERKVLLVGHIILAVKQLCSVESVRQHLDSKKLEVVDVARASRTKLAGSFGHDHIHKCSFFGLRLHTLVDDNARLCRVLLRPANEHDPTVAPCLLAGLNYRIITADKGYISQDFKAELDAQAVHLVTPRRRNQVPMPKPEKRLYKGHRIIESVFSSLERLGLSDRPYRSTTGLILHIYSTILAYQLRQLLRVWLCLFRIRVL